MCDAKLQIPFQSQEISIKEEVPLNKIKIPYTDPTTEEKVSLKSSSLTKSFWSGKTSFDIVGDICDFQNYIQAKGILKIENLKIGPMETSGGIVEFKRLFLRFNELEIPIQIKYDYQLEEICKEPVTTNKMPTLDSYFQQTMDVSAVPLEEKEDAGLVVEIHPTQETPVKFTKYFTTNADNEKNQNLLMNNLEPEFKKYDSSFNQVFQANISNLSASSLAKRIEEELKRIICLSKKSSEETIKTAYSRYQQKVHHLRELNIYSIIYHK